MVSRYPANWFHVAKKTCSLAFKIKQRQGDTRADTLEEAAAFTTKVLQPAFAAAELPKLLKETWADCFNNRKSGAHDD